MRSAVLALMSVAVLTLVGCGTAKPHPPAPTTAALRLAPGLKVGRSVPGDSDIDSADGRHYRYMIVVGPHRASPVGILRSEVHVLQRAGWRRGTTTASAANGGSQVTGLSRRGAVTLLYRAKGSIYVALEYVKSMGDLEGATELNPGAPVGSLRRLLRRGFPMLSATLGHQND